MTEEYTTSLKMAKVLNQPHRNIMEKIQRVLIDLPPNFNAHSIMPDEYLDENNETQSMYKLKRNAALYVMTGILQDDF